MLKIITTILLIIYTLPSYADQPKITLVSDVWCPWVCDDKDNPGFMVEIAQVVFAKHGYIVDFKLTPWTRAVAELNEGTVTGILATDPTQSGLEKAIFPQESIASMQNMYLISTSSNFRYINDYSLQGKTIGVVNGYNYGGGMGKYVKDHYSDTTKIKKLFGDNAGEHNVKLIATKSNDIYIDDNYVLQYLIKKLHLETQVKIGGSLGDNIPQFIAFSPAFPDAKKIADTFDLEIKKLKSDGTVDKIINKYRK